MNPPAPNGGRGELYPYVAPIVHAVAAGSCRFLFSATPPGGRDYCPIGVIADGSTALFVFVRGRLTLKSFAILSAAALACLDRFQSPQYGSCFRLANSRVSKLSLEYLFLRFHSVYVQQQQQQHHALFFSLPLRTGTLPFRWYCFFRTHTHTRTQFALAPKIIFVVSSRRS